VHEPGRLLASGRDSDIFEYDSGLVLRRSRDGRSMADEARIMEYLARHGYPVPAIAEISGDGRDLVMERINGVSMVEAIGRAPWTVRRQARTLARLHRELHEIDPPDFLPRAPVGEGSSVVHMDLHPLNVIVERDRAVVIDWTGAGVGDPDVDVAIAWVLMSAGEIPGGGIRTKLLGFGRTLLTDGFIAGFERERVVSALRSVVEWKVTDPHMSTTEVEQMWRAVEKAEAGLRR
jgi:aminoglycoside phosphotransferase (APT) family kinase protein